MSAIQNPAVDPGFMLSDTPLQPPVKPLPLTVRAKKGDTTLVFASDPGGFAAEQYRVIRRTLVEKYPDGASILVTSPTSGDGKTLTATNLAWCLAEAGMPTLLAEMDLRNPSIDRLLGSSLPRPGIESLLENGGDPKAFLRQVNRMQFYVATARDPLENPVDLLTGTHLRDFATWAKENHKWVIWDSPPALTLADAAELSALTDCTLLVVRARVTPKVLVERAIELLGSRLQQVIMNEGSECADSSHRYFAAYYPYGARKQK